MEEFRMNIADYKGVWVFAEQREGSLQKVSLELLGEGRKIADKLGV
jgi:electron transfer flavoprotein alpha subunit